jgi:hypothetical protein
MIFDLKTIFKCIHSLPFRRHPVRWRIQ